MQVDALQPKLGVAEDDLQNRSFVWSECEGRDQSSGATICPNGNKGWNATARVVVRNLVTTRFDGQSSLVLGGAT